MFICFNFYVWGRNDSVTVNFFTHGMHSQTCKLWELQTAPKGASRIYGREGGGDLPKPTPKT